MKNDYSAKEYAMISELSPHLKSVIDKDVDNSIMPPQMLEMVAMHCFINNQTGPAADSLRRCIKALHTCSAYRQTPEYEKLIDL